MAAVAGSGCYSFSARDSEHALRLVAPSSVKHGEIFTFHVEVVTKEGDRAPEITYGWLLDWPDVRGVMQVGKAFEPQHKEAKCGPGTAVLRIYVKDSAKRPVQVARQDIQVE